MSFSKPVRDGFDWLVDCLLGEILQPGLNAFRWHRHVPPITSLTDRIARSAVPLSLSLQSWKLRPFAISWTRPHMGSQRLDTTDSGKHSISCLATNDTMGPSESTQRFSLSPSHLFVLQCYTRRAHKEISALRQQNLGPAGNKDECSGFQSTSFAKIKHYHSQAPLTLG